MIFATVSYAKITKFDLRFVTTLPTDSESWKKMTSESQKKEKKMKNDNTDGWVTNRFDTLCVITNCANILKRERKNHDFKKNSKTKKIQFNHISKETMKKANLSLCN